MNWPAAMAKRLEGRMAAFNSEQPEAPMHTIPQITIIRSMTVDAT